MKDALPLLAALEGNGVSAEKANRSGWQGGFSNITYDSGPTPGAVVNIDHLMQGYIAPVWDVIGVINGTSPEEVVVIGNHRDAWVIGGAADPNSGSAILIELANAFGKLLAKGWKPRRTMYDTPLNLISMRLTHRPVFSVLGTLKNLGSKALQSGSKHTYRGYKPQLLPISTWMSVCRVHAQTSEVLASFKHLSSNR